MPALYDLYQEIRAYRKSKYEINLIRIDTLFRNTDARIAYIYFQSVIVTIVL